MSLIGDLGEIKETAARFNTDIADISFLLIDVESAPTAVDDLFASVGSKIPKNFFCIAFTGYGTKQSAALKRSLFWFKTIGGQTVKGQSKTQLSVLATALSSICKAVWIEAGQSTEMIEDAIAGVAADEIFGCGDESSFGRPRYGIKLFGRNLGYWESAPNVPSTASGPGEGYICVTCGQQGGEGGHWLQQCPKSTRSIPKAGYKCKKCGKRGGDPDSHWFQYCPNPRPSRDEDKDEEESS